MSTEEDNRTYGSIRKKIEIKMSNHIGMDANKAQINKIRELAPQVAEGKITYEDAIKQVKDLAEWNNPTA